MPLSLALLFPGQGVQHPDMLRFVDTDKHAAPVIAQMNESLGQGWRERIGDESWSTGNLVAQTLLVGIEAAAWAAIGPLLPAPVAVAGYSVGELAACHAVGVFDAAAALMLARERAEAMRASGSLQPGGLLAVAGVSTSALDSMCARLGLSVAIRIAADRCVIGGPASALDAAAAELQRAGAEPSRLRIQVASHTTAMTAAAQAFARLIEPLSWQRAGAVVVCNLDGIGRWQAPALKAALAGQIDHMLRWDRCLASIAERRPHCVLEIGPGTSLARMWSQHCPAVPARSLDEFGSAAAAAAWVQRHAS